MQDCLVGLVPGSVMTGGYSVVVRRGELMNVLVLGGTRFVGRALVDVLAEDHEVTVANRGTHRMWRNDVSVIAFDRGAGPELSALTDLRQFDSVVDVSATEPVHVRQVVTGWPAAMRDIPYVLISSAGVYDRTVNPPPFEEGMVTPGDEIWGEYGKAKAQCEVLLAREFGHLTCLRPPYVYGPHNYEERERWLWARLLRGKTILIPRDGRSRLQFCHTDLLANVVSGVLTGTVPAGTYNVAEPANYSVVEYLEALAEAAGKHLRTTEVHDGRQARSYFPFRDADLTLVVDKLASHLDVTGPTLAQGLASSLVWCHANDALGYTPTGAEAELLAL